MFRRERDQKGFAVSEITSFKNMDLRGLGLMDLACDEAMSVLSKIEIVYTDLDGTLLAPGGKLLCDFSGDPSTAIAEAMVALKNLGIQIVIVTGRSRIQGNEFIRLLDADEFIGEMGTTIQKRDTSNLDIKYDTGSFYWDKETYKTPYDAIADSGAIETLLKKYCGKIEYNYPRCLNRDVTHAMRGYVDVDEVNTFFESSGYQLALEDNGMIFTVKETTLENIPEIHGYHVVPAGTSKAVAVAKDIERKGLDVSQALAIGDGAADIEMGHSAGAYVMMANGLRSQRCLDKLAKLEVPTFLTSRFCCDGWVEFAQALLKSKQ